MEITNTPATGLPAKMSLTIFGIPEKNSGTCVTPMPMLSTDAGARGLWFSFGIISFYLIAGAA